MRIKKLEALEVIDSKGLPTIEVNLIYGDEYKSFKSKVIVPAQKTSISRLKEFRDNKKARFFGMGVKDAARTISTFIAKALGSHTFKTQEDLDSYLKELDGTEDLSNLGSNSILAISMAYYKATSMAQGLQLYQRISTEFGFELSFPKPIYTLFSDTEKQLQLGLVGLEQPSFKRSNRQCLEIIQLLGDMQKMTVAKIAEAIKKMKYHESVGIYVSAPQENIGNILKKIDGIQIVTYSPKRFPEKHSISDTLDHEDRLEITHFATISECLFALQERDKKVLMHDTNDTEDTLVGHIAVGAGCDYIYFNGFKGTEIFSTVNEIIRIQTTLQNEDSIVL